MQTALLVLDAQKGSLARLEDPVLERGALDAIRRATEAARANGIPVIYVRLAFRNRALEVSPRNRILYSKLQDGTFNFDETDAATAIHSDVAPQPGDIVVVKKRVSAFVGSDLDVILRSLDVDTLVITGMSTRGVVLSTVRYAADMDFRITILRDGCADGDRELADLLMDRLFPKQADVTSADAWIAQLQFGSAPQG